MSQMEQEYDFAQCAKIYQNENFDDLQMSTRENSRISNCNNSLLFEEIPSIQANLESVPANILNLISMFLSSNELVLLISCGRIIKERIEQQARLSISLKAINYFFSSEISQWVEYGDSEEYLAAKSVRNLRVADSLKYSMLGYLQKSSRIQQAILSNESLAPLAELCSTLRNPAMPTMKIRRENVGRFAHSWFQNKLVEIYCDRAAASSQSKSINPLSKLNLLSKSSSLAGGLNNSKLSFLSGNNFAFKAPVKKIKQFSMNIAQSQKEQQQQQQWLNEQSNTQIVELLENIRWYKDIQEEILMDNVNNNNTVLNKFIQENASVKVAMLISFLFKERCIVMHEYLNSIYSNTSFYDMVSEYNLAWNTFQASILEAQDNFDEILKSFDEVYFAQIGVKLFPEYSILRVASHHWARIVLLPLKTKLFESFFSVLQARRNENLNMIISNDFSSVAERKAFFMQYVPDRLSSVSEHLQHRLLENPTVASIDTLLNVSGSEKQIIQEKSFQAFFSKNSYFVDNLLSTFVENIIDLSVNEQSVHWLGHSSIQIGSLYSELSASFIEITQKYLASLDQTIFAGSPLQWKEFLMSELKYSRKIMKEITMKEVASMTFSQFFASFARDVSNDSLIGCKLDKINASVYSNTERDQIAGKMQEKGFTIAAIQAVLGSLKAKDAVSAFINMVNEEAEYINATNSRDEDLEDQNAYSQISKTLVGEQFIFYGMINEIDASTLEIAKIAAKKRMESAKLIAPPQQQVQMKVPSFLSANNNNNFSFIPSNSQ